MYDREPSPFFHELNKKTAHLSRVFHSKSFPCYVPQKETTDSITYCTIYCRKIYIFHYDFIPFSRWQQRNIFLQLSPSCKALLYDKNGCSSFGIFNFKLSTQQTIWFDQFINHIFNAFHEKAMINFESINLLWKHITFSIFSNYLRNKQIMKVIQ